MKKLVLVIVVFVLVVFVVPTVLLNFTTAPLHVAAWFLEKKNIQMSDFEGSLSAGFTIGLLKSVGSDHEVELQGIRFLYPGIASMRENDKIIIDQMSVDSFRLVVRDFKAMKSRRSRAKSTASGRTAAPSDEPEVESRGENTVKPFLVRKIFVRNGQISLPKMEMPLLFTEFSIDDLDVTESGMRMASGKFLSNRIDLVATGLELNFDDSLKMAAPAELVIKPLMQPLLKQDLRIKFKVALSDGGEKRSGFVEALDGALRTEMNDQGAISLTVKDLEFQKHFVVETPLQRMNVKLAVPNMMALAAGQYEFDGSVVAYDQEFALKKETGGAHALFPTFVGVKPQNRSRLKINLSDFVMTAMMQIGFWQKGQTLNLPLPVRLESDDPKLLTFSDVAADYYFNRPKAKLKKEEVATLEASLKVFGLNPAAPAIAEQKPEAPLGLGGLFGGASAIAATVPSGGLSRAPAAVSLPSTQESSWEGYYSYETKSAAVPIKLTLKCAADKCTGTAEEPNTFGSLKDGVVLHSEVAGTLSPSELRFVKTHRSKSGTVHTLEYEGTLSPDGKVSGRWAAGQNSGPFTLKRK